MKKNGYMTKDNMTRRTPQNFLKLSSKCQDTSSVFPTIIFILYAKMFPMALGLNQRLTTTTARNQERNNIEWVTGHVGNKGGRTTLFSYTPLRPPKLTILLRLNTKGLTRSTLRIGFCKTTSSLIRSPLLARWPAQTDATGVTSASRHRNFRCSEMFHQKNKKH